MELRDYLHFHRVKKKHLANKIGYCVAHLANIAERRSRPSRRTALAIQEATGGIVTAQELLSGEYISYGEEEKE